MIYAVLRAGTDEYELHTLKHHGISGQKWGVRRYQNADGTWTEAGKERYGDPGMSKKDRKREAKEMNSLMKKSKKSFRPGNYSMAYKLSKTSPIQKLADDKDLRAKAKKSSDLENKMYSLQNKKDTLESRLGIYGDDLDGWDEKTGKANYGIDKKQYEQIMAARSQYSKAKSDYKNANKQYNDASRAKAQTFVKDYFSKPYSKIKVNKDTEEQYTNYISRILDIRVQDI